MFHSNVSQPKTNRFSLMCMNLNQMSHSYVPQQEINVSVQCGPPYIFIKTIFVYFKAYRFFWFSSIHNASYDVLSISGKLWFFGFLRKIWFCLTSFRIARKFVLNITVVNYVIHLLKIWKFHRRFEKIFTADDATKLI